MSLHSDTLFLSSFTTYHRVCNQINTTGATNGAGTAYPSGAPEFTPEFQYSSCYSIFSFICMFCRSLFVLLYFFFRHCVVCLALNNNHLLHCSFLFTKPDFLWFFNMFMMFTYLKLSMFVSSTGQNDQVKYYHLVSVVCYPLLFILIFIFFLRNCKTKCFNYFTLSSFGIILQRIYSICLYKTHMHQRLPHHDQTQRVM